jgi:hypothetical protein
MQIGKSCILLSGVVAFMCSVSSPVLAVTAPANATDQLTVAIRGHISPRCAVVVKGPEAVSFSQMTDSADKAIAASVNLPFSYECNTSFTASLTSRNGGLSHQGQSATGFSSLVSYSASLGVQRGSGSLALSCNSATMQQGGNGNAAACRNASRDHGYSAGDGAIKVTLNPGGQPLLAGNYSDELTLQLTPNLGGAAD